MSSHRHESSAVVIHHESPTANRHESPIEASRQLPASRQAGSHSGQHEVLRACLGVVAGSLERDVHLGAAPECGLRQRGLLRHLVGVRPDDGLHVQLRGQGDADGREVGQAALADGLLKRLRRRHDGRGEHGHGVEVAGLGGAREHGLHEVHGGRVKGVGHVLGGGGDRGRGGGESMGDGSMEPGLY